MEYGHPLSLNSNEPMGCNPCSPGRKMRLSNKDDVEVKAWTHLRKTWSGGVKVRSGSLGAFHAIEIVV
eukprot:2315556-Amphidinium_carterae.1